jgi:hypothetical protein
MAGETLRILNGAEAGARIPLQGDFVVGRAETGMGNLAGDSEISRRHARFELTAYGQVIVEDLGSTNGTRVNGERLDRPRVLSNGDRITVGKTILQLDANTQATAVGDALPPAAAVAAAAAPPAAPPPEAPPGPPAPAYAPPAPAYAPPVSPTAYGGGQGFAGGPISGPPGAVPPSNRPRWLPAAAVAVAALIVAGAVVAVIANSGSDSGNATPGAAATQAAPAPSAPRPPAVQSVAALEASLKSALSGVSSSGPRVTAVSCPASAPAAAGATFDCQVQGQQGLSGTVTVTLKDSQRKAYSFKAALQGNGFTRTVTGSVG